jgi:hypothetical protein
MKPMNHVQFRYGKINYEKKVEDVPLLDIAIDQECDFIKINAILV